jgi:lipoprotein-anchoring transpeptidase ErfK/SrfK
MVTQIVKRVVFLFLLLGMAALPCAAGTSKIPAPGDHAIGSIIIKTGKRQLLYVRGKNDIVAYPIAVGREGRKWTGKTRISRKVRNPDWAPPPHIRKDNPKLPALVKAGPNNPLGVAVLVLGNGTYGIHGTNRPGTVGTSASYGCFRMYNADILSLFKQVRVGAAVYVQR